jgi:hypothetical protein
MDASRVSIVELQPARQRRLLLPRSTESSERRASRFEPYSFRL